VALLFIRFRVSKSIKDLCDISLIERREREEFQFLAPSSFLNYYILIFLTGSNDLLFSLLESSCQKSIKNIYYIS
jgi:hypothetical protein